MIIDPEDPRLTSYLLGECSPEEAATIEQALEENPSLRKALEEIKAGEQQLRAEFAPHAPALLDSQRDRILQIARGAQSAPDANPRSRWIPVIVATVVLFGIAFVLMKTPTPKSSGDPSSSQNISSPGTSHSVPQLTPKAAALPFPGPESSNGSSSENDSEQTAAVKLRNEVAQSSSSNYPRLVTDALGPDFDLATLPATSPREPVSSSVTPFLELPVVAGHSSLGWISTSVIDKQELPPAKAVRVEELLNAFTLTPTGASAISGGASLSMETFACPWKPSSTLLMTRIQGAVDGSREIHASLEVDPEVISSFRLLGFAPVKGLERDTLLHTLPAKTGTTLLVELESRSSHRDLGFIRWKIDGTDAATLPIIRNPEAEPSNDARFAALLATWSMWLRGESTAIVDADFVGGLGRECASANLPENRKEALVLIAKSLELATGDESDQ